MLPLAETTRTVLIDVLVAKQQAQSLLIISGL
jgi:hypothetical protein